MSAHTLVTERHLAQPPAEVFAALTDPVRLARWWGLAGFTNTFHVCDVRPGGEWSFVMHGPDGTDYPNESRFLELEPPTRWVIDHAGEPHFVLTVTLTAEGRGTRLVWSGELDTAEACADIAAYAVPAVEEVLDRLAAELAG